MLPDIWCRVNCRCTPTAEQDRCHDPPPCDAGGGQVVTQRMLGRSCPAC